jgi:hypothetical protein
MKSSYKDINIAGIFMREIFRLHGIPKVIMFDKDVKFTRNFWKTLFKGLDTQLNLSMDYHPQMDGKIEITNQILEDMLRMYVMDIPSKWEEYLYLVEFAYNNHYQASTQLRPFEILYGKKM